MEQVERIFFIILIFGLINLVLYGAQELYYSGDTKRINQIDQELEKEKEAIAILEDKLANTKEEIKQKDIELEKYKSSGFIDEYNNGVSGFNALLNTYNKDLDDYNKMIKFYNNKVEEENLLIEKSGSRWYLIPIPLPSKSIRSKI